MRRMLPRMLKHAPLVTVALSLFAAPAAAQSKSWTAVSKSVNTGAAIVVGVNLKPIRATTTYASALKLFLDEEESAKQAFEMIKGTCAIDVPAAISDATVIMKNDEKPLVVLGLDGLDETKVVACLEKIGNAMAQAAGSTVAIKLTAKKKGKVTEYSMAGEKKKIYIAWLAADVLAFTDDPNDKGKITKMIAGKPPKGALGSMIAKVSTTAPIWFAVSKKDKEEWGTILGGYGQVDITGGTITGTGHLVVAKPAEAVAAAAEGNKGLAEAKTEAAQAAGVLKVLNTITITAAGSQVDMTGSVADKDIMGLLPQLDSIF